LLADDAATDDVIGNRTLEDQGGSDTLVPVGAKKLTAWLQGFRNNLKWAFANLFTKAAANTWVDVPYTAESGVAMSGTFSVKYNAALGIMRIHFTGEKISTFTIGMKVMTLTLPKAIPDIQRAVIGFDLGNTSTTGRQPMGIDVNTNGIVAVFAYTADQGTGAFPALDGGRIYGDAWVYLG
jgi:hypothetical protein